MTTSPYTGHDPFANRPDVLSLYEPLVGNSMLELGNKRDNGVAYKPYFEAKGFRHVSIDLNGEDGALQLDLRKPLNLGKFDMVINLGTSEHVEDNQEAVWRNIFEALSMDGVLINMTPLPGEWQWHGFHYPHQKFFEEMARLNGCEVERLYEAGVSPRKNVFARLKRVMETDFRWPINIELLMFYNSGGKRYAWL